MVHQRIDGQNAEPAAIGDDAEPVAGEGRVARQRLGGRDQFVESVTRTRPERAKAAA